MSTLDAVGSSGVDQHKIINLIEFVMTCQSFSIRQALNASGMSIEEFSKVRRTVFCLDNSLNNLNYLNYLDEKRTWQLSVDAVNCYREYLDMEEFKSSQSNRAAFVIRGTMAISFILISGALLYSVSL